MAQQPCPPFYVVRVVGNETKRLQFRVGQTWSNKPAGGKETLEIAYDFLDLVSCSEVDGAYVADRSGREVDRTGQFA